MHAEQTVKDLVVDERTCEEILTEGKTEILNLSYGHRERRREMPHLSKHSILRNLPDAEEAQHMIYADGIEILRHPTEATTEPRRQALLIPSICREAPGLPVLREGIRWSPHLTVKVEELRMERCLYTFVIDPDRKIPLDKDTLRTSFICSSLQLQM